MDALIIDKSRGIEKYLPYFPSGDVILDYGDGIFETTFQDICTLFPELAKKILKSKRYYEIKIDNMVLRINDIEYEGFTVSLEKDLIEDIRGWQLSYGTVKRKYLPLWVMSLYQVDDDGNVIIGLVVDLEKDRTYLVYLDNKKKEIAFRDVKTRDELEDIFSIEPLDNEEHILRYHIASLCLKK